MSLLQRYDNITREVICHGDPCVIKKGYKSFPSGRTSWFLAGLGLLWYLAGKIKAFDRGFHSAKLCIVAMPLILVAMAGVSLVDDYRHHWQDVFTAGVLRLVVVSFCYLQFFPPLSGEQDSSFIPTSSTCLPLKGRTGRGLRRGNRTCYYFQASNSGTAICSYH